MKKLVIIPTYNERENVSRMISKVMSLFGGYDLLIVDETLSVGDVFFQEKCLNKIRSFIDSGRVTVLFVSHSMDQVAHICSRCVWIEKGQQRMDGPTAEVLEAYENQFK